MDNLDLPLVVAELLIDVQYLKARVALLENTFAEVRDDLHAIRDDMRATYEDMRATHDELAEQGRNLTRVLEKVQAVLLERPAPDPAVTSAAAANPVNADDARAADAPPAADLTDPAGPAY